MKIIDFTLAFFWTAVLLFLIAVILLATGCTTFHSNQTDQSPNERTITTDVKATAWFSSAQSIAGLKTTTTDKTQSFGSAAIGQQGATNSANVLRELRGLLELLRTP
jgi:hypothetical protein